VVQQAELVANPIVISEHRAFAYVCAKCGKVHYAELPPEVRLGGLFGPRLTAFVAFLKGGCHASYSTVQAVLEWVLGVPVSRGFLASEVDKVSDALNGPYEELLRQVRAEARLNVDETGHKNKGRLEFTWCFRAELFALFKIAPSRGSDVLLKVLGDEFNGILGCDYFSAYRKYMADFNVLVQFCLAHLIRDVKFLLTVPDKATQNYGERVLAGLRNLFHVIHRREKMSEKKFHAALEQARRDLVTTAKRAPMISYASNIAERFRQHGDAYFRFITTPGIEPTNNLAEQAIRFVVIDRRVTQGTRGETGQRWCERIWTVLATCAIRHRSAFQYIHQAVRAYWGNQPVPSLLFDSS
jgi:transposase